LRFAITPFNGGKTKVLPLTFIFFKVFCDRVKLVIFV